MLPILNLSTEEKRKAIVLDLKALYDLLEEHGPEDLRDPDFENPGAGAHEPCDLFIALVEALAGQRDGELADIVEACTEVVGK